MKNKAKVFLDFSNGQVRVQLLFKELSLQQVRKVNEGKYYIIEDSMSNQELGVTVKAKIWLPIKIVNQINLKNRKGKIGNVFFQLQNDNNLLIKSINLIPLNKVKTIDGKNIIDIIDNSQSIINIHYSLPVDLYHQFIPKSVVTKAHAKSAAQKLTNQMLNGNYPKEKDDKPKCSTVKEKQKTKEKNPIRNTQSPRIWVAKDTAFKRCNHCINFRSNKFCYVHKINVQKDNACSRFYTPRVYLGGSVSPR